MGLKPHLMNRNRTALVVCALLFAAPVAAAAGAGATVPAAGADATNDEPGAGTGGFVSAGPVDVWTRSALATEVDSSDAATTVDGPTVVLSGPDVPDAPIDRDPAAFHEDATATVVFHGRPGVDLSQFEEERFDLVAARIPDAAEADVDLGDGIVGPGSVADLLRDDAATFDVVASNRSLSGDPAGLEVDVDLGAAGGSADADAYVFFVVGHGDVNVPEGDVAVPGGDGTVYGVTAAPVTDEASTLTTPGRVAPGEDVEVGADSHLNGSDVTHVVTVYDEETLSGSRVDVEFQEPLDGNLSAGDVRTDFEVEAVRGELAVRGTLGPRLAAALLAGSSLSSAAPNETLREVLADANGSELVDDADASELLDGANASELADDADASELAGERFVPDLRETVVANAPRVGLGDLLSTLASRTSPSASPSEEGVVLNGSTTVLPDAPANATVSVETFSDWSTGQYRVVHVAVDRSSGEVATASELVTMAPESDPGEAAFDVDVANATHPVTAGENLTVNATVENLGSAAGTTNVTLSVGDAVVDRTTVTDLAPGASTTVALRYRTEQSDVGSLNASVATRDERESLRVTVRAGPPTDPGSGTDPGPPQDPGQGREPGTPANPGAGLPPGPPSGDDPAEFDVVDVQTGDAPVAAGQSVAVEATVENVGGADGTQRVQLSVDGEVVAEQSVALGAGERATVTLEAVAPADVANGPLEVDVSTDDDRVTRQLSAGDGSAGDDASSGLRIRDLGVNATSIGSGDAVEVSVTVENAGDADRTGTVELALDGDAVASESVSLGAGESTTVVAELGPDDGLQSGEHELRATVDGDAATTSITVGADDGLPGFTGAAALAGVLGALLVLRRRTA